MYKVFKVLLDNYIDVNHLLHVKNVLKYTESQDYVYIKIQWEGLMFVYNCCNVVVCWA